MYSKYKVHYNLIECLPMFFSLLHLILIDLLYVTKH